MLLNWALNTSNPSPKNLTDNDNKNAEVYGIDSEGPSLFENSNNNVAVILELHLNRDIKVIQQLLSERFGLLAPSTQMEIDIFRRRRTFLVSIVCLLRYQSRDFCILTWFICQFWSKIEKQGGRRDAEKLKQE